jgi:PAS domain S-box-containing protein
MTSSLSTDHRRRNFVNVALLIVAIAIADWKINSEVPIGFLYLLPIVLAGRFLRRWQVALLAAVCAVLAELFDGLNWSLLSGFPRDLLYLSAFAGVGLFACEMAASRRAAAKHTAELEGENQARRDAEEQLEILIESSPVAVFTADANGRVLMANNAAHRLFDLDAGALQGQDIARYLPSIVNVPDLRSGQQSFRTVMQCKGRRRSGEIFLADVWFSTYRTSAGPRLAAMVVDSSEQLRDREEASLHQLLTGSRILVSAVSHEIRNICGAIAVVHANLARSGALFPSMDFEALGTLVLALEKVAGMELRGPGTQGMMIELQSFFDELRIVVSPALRERDIELQWDLPSELPSAWADPQCLMQVFLNLTQNSERALAGRNDGELKISAAAVNQHVLIRVADTGAGINNPELLFQPFQPHAKATGLGLYLSRALMRSFGGDLRYESSPLGATFVVELACDMESTGARQNQPHTD